MVIFHSYVSHYQRVTAHVEYQKSQSEQVIDPKLGSFVIHGNHNIRLSGSRKSRWFQRRMETLQVVSRMGNDGQSKTFDMSIHDDL